jgi:hypothetical protein
MPKHWVSGLQLAAAMASRVVRASVRVLEIGCGLGLASLVLHRRGVNVTASDCHPLAGGFLRENLRLNALQPMTAQAQAYSGRLLHYRRQEAALRGEWVRRRPLGRSPRHGSEFQPPHPDTGGPVWPKKN